MRRVLVVTWALGTASGVLLGLFGVQLVSSRFSTSRVSPLSHPEVVRALQAARSVPAAPDEVALPSTPDRAVPPPSPPADVAPARPSAGATSPPAPASPASSLPRPGATAGTLVDPTAGVAANPPTTVSTAPAAPEPPPTSTSATTATTEKPKSKSSDKSSTTSTTEKKSTTTTSGNSSKASPTTISCSGGVVTVRFSDGKVELKAARPNSGYRVYVPEQENPGEVIVYFYNNNTAYQVRAFYNYGTPDSKVTKYQWSDRRDQSDDR